MAQSSAFGVAGNSLLLQRPLLRPLQTFGAVFFHTGGKRLRGGLAANQHWCSGRTALPEGPPRPVRAEFAAKWKDSSDSNESHGSMLRRHRIGCISHTCRSVPAVGDSEWTKLRSTKGEPVADLDGNSEEFEILSLPKTQSSAQSQDTPPPSVSGGTGGFNPRADPGPSGAFPGLDVPEAPEEVRLLFCMQTEHSSIAVLQFPDIAPVFGSSLAGCTLLKLDSSPNAHSLYHPKRVWTDSYWDDLAAAAALAPRGGSVGILGLGAGTTARIIRKFRPDLIVEGWEIDELVIDVGRDFFGLGTCEKPSPEGGALMVHVGDAFDASSSNPKGFDCLVVDLFSEGQVLGQLRDPATWQTFKEKLAPGGRIVVNCGGPSLEPALAEKDDAWQTVAASMRAALDVFPNEAFYKSTSETSNEDSNYLLLLGAPLDVDSWEQELPPQLKSTCMFWHPLKPDSICFTR